MKIISIVLVSLALLSFKPVTAQAEIAIDSLDPQTALFIGIGLGMQSARISAGLGEMPTQMAFDISRTIPALLRSCTTIDCVTNTLNRTAQQGYLEQQKKRSNPHQNK